MLENMHVKCMFSELLRTLKESSPPWEILEALEPWSFSSIFVVDLTQQKTDINDVPNFS